MKLQTYLDSQQLSDKQFGEMIGVDPLSVWRYRSWPKSRHTRRPEWGPMERIVKATDGRVQPNDFFSDAV